jgi:acyl-CoA reductase-like NAD-dependent aldehyde dehydrogenase
MTLIKASGGFVRLQLGLFARRVSWSEPIYKSGCSHYRPFTAITQEDYRHDNSKSNSSGGFVVQDLPSYNVQFIGGRWTAPTPNQDLVGTIGVFDSNTGQEVASVPRGSEEDTILAIKAAKDAFQVWREVPLSKRIQLIRMFLSKFEAKRDEIVNRLTVELGCTTKFARQVQFGASVVNVKTFLRLLEDCSSNNNKGNSKSAGNRFEFEYSAGRCTVVKEPIGVVGAITPWNYPPLQILLKVVPALLVGCTVVLKPSEVTPLCSYSVVEAFDEAIKEINDDDIPSGIFNMVMGYGPECGQILASHPDVNLLSFTGSTRGGQILSELASKTMKPITTELGGKSAAILLDDADYETAVPEFVKQLMGNTGQTCDALSRMLVPRKDYEDVVDIAKRVFEEERVGTSTNPDATMGPLASKLQYDRVQFALEKGVEEGARVVVGGPGRPVDPSLPENGYFVQPTLFAGVSNDMTIAREEIFGPVLSLIAYDTEEEAIMIANDTVYGLSNAVASSDMSRALKVASRLESGMVMVNGTTVDTLAPFGGCKMSGNGRECGAAGLEEFLVTKTINIPIEKYRSAIAKVN